MTANIKTIARQAGLIAPHGSDHEGLANFDYREFAKLIIEECINACATDDLGKTVSVEQLIKNHFK